MILRRARPRTAKGSVETAAMIMSRGMSAAIIIPSGARILPARDKEQACCVLAVKPILMGVQRRIYLCQRGGVIDLDHVHALSSAHDDCAGNVMIAYPGVGCGLCL